MEEEAADERVLREQRPHRLCSASPRGDRDGDRVLLDVEAGIERDLRNRVFMARADNSLVLWTEVEVLISTSSIAFGSRSARSVRLVKQDA